jgi:hypothetical protein
MVFAPVFVNPRVANAGLKNSERTITKLAAKWIDVEKPQQTLRNCDSPQPLDVFARTVWAIYY